jgi:hypothetical protein
MLAGGGIRGGTVQDKHGAHVQNRPVSPEDFGATLLTALGVLLSKPLNPDGSTYPASPGQPLREILDGELWGTCSGNGGNRAYSGAAILEDARATPAAPISGESRPLPRDARRHTREGRSPANSGGGARCCLADPDHRRPLDLLRRNASVERRAGERRTPPSA